MKLSVRKEGLVVSSVRLDREMLVLGRSKECDVILLDNDVSRRHAKILRESGNVVLEDLESANGIRMRNERVRRAELKLGDTFTIGPFEITLEAAGSTDEVTAEATDVSLDTTFPEATTDLRPDERAIDSFLDAISVRPSPGAEGEGRVLKNFLEDAPTPPEEPARLVRLDGETVGKEIPIEKEQVTLGSAKDCDITINEAEVSKSHATIEKIGPTYVLKDQADSTGTFVDGVPIRERELENHDIVHVGSARFEFVQGTARSRAQKSAVIERPRKPFLLASLLQDWRAVVAIGVALGVLFSFLFLRPSHRPASSSTQETDENSETARLVRQHTERARLLLTERKYDEAESHLRKILESIAPGDPTATELMKQLQGVRSAERRNEAEQRGRKAKEEERICALLEKGDRFAEEGDVAKARAAYHEALTIDPSDQGAKGALIDLDHREERERNVRESRQKSDAELQKLYMQGVAQYEAGDLGGAERLLTGVAQRKGHAYQASAQRIIADIHRQSDGKIRVRLQKAQELSDNGDFLAAKKEVEALLKQFPRRDDAKRLLRKVNDGLAAKAKQSYAEGIAYQELMEDLGAALEKFKETLKYSPDPKSEYYRKATKKISELSAK